MNHTGAAPRAAPPPIPQSRTRALYPHTAHECGCSFLACRNPDAGQKPHTLPQRQVLWDHPALRQDKQGSLPGRWPGGDTSAGGYRRSAGQRPVGPAAGFPRPPTAESSGTSRGKSHRGEQERQPGICQGPKQSWNRDALAASRHSPLHRGSLRRTRPSVGLTAHTTKSPGRCCQQPGLCRFRSVSEGGLEPPCPITGTSTSS